MYEVTFEAAYSNIHYGKADDDQPYGHLTALIRVQVGGTVAVEGHREYTPKEAVQAAMVLVKGLRISCRKVVKLDLGDDHYNAIQGVEITLEPAPNRFAEPTTMSTRLDTAAAALAKQGIHPKGGAS